MDSPPGKEPLELDARWASDALPMELKLSIVEAITPAELGAHMWLVYDCVDGVLQDPYPRFNARYTEDWKPLQVARAVCISTRSALHRFMKESATLRVYHNRTCTNRLSRRRNIELDASSGMRESANLVPIFNQFITDYSCMLTGFVGETRAWSSLLETTVEASRDPSTHRLTALKVKCIVNATSDVFNITSYEHDFDGRPLDLVLNAMRTIERDITRYFQDLGDVEINASHLPISIEHMISLNAPLLFHSGIKWQVTMFQVWVDDKDDKDEEPVGPVPCTVSWSFGSWLTTEELATKIKIVEEHGEDGLSGSASCSVRRDYPLGFN